MLIKGTNDQEDFKYEMDLPDYYSDGEKNEDYKKNEDSKTIKKRKKANKKTATVKKEKSTFKCSICARICDNRDELKAHRKDEHNAKTNNSGLVKIHHCKLCSKDFRGINELWNHNKNEHRIPYGTTHILRNHFQGRGGGS